jgi:hypothetical protein
MEIYLIYGLIVAFCVFIAIQWTRGIVYMDSNHSDYKGEDFLGDI